MLAVVRGRSARPARRGWPAKPRSRGRVAESGAAFEEPEISCDAALAPATEKRADLGEFESPRFARLLDDHGGAILGFLRRLVGDWSTALDLRQETLVRALTAMRRYGGPQRTRPWLFRIALRTAADFWRDRTNRRGQELESGGAWEADPAASADIVAAEREEREITRRRIRSALDRLAPLTRSVLELRYVHGLSVAEIGERLRVTPVAVRVRLCRARECVRRILTDDECDPSSGEKT